MCGRLTLMSLAIFTALYCANFGTAGEYSVTDLGFHGAYYGSQAFGINDSGQVVGYQLYKSGRTDGTSAFIWQDGQLRNLNRGNMSYAEAINASGQVIGGELGTGFLWQNGTFAQLGPSVPWAINDSTHVVGGTKDFNAVGSQAFLWQNGNFTLLGPGFAFAINNRDQIAGLSALTSHAVLWQNGRMLDLGTLGGTTSVAYAVNGAGAVVGLSSLPGDQTKHGFLWQNGNMLDLGKGLPHAINKEGLVVGESDVSYSDHSGTALLWRNGTATDLNTLIPPDSGWALLAAMDINDMGQIVGFGIHDNHPDAFLLTPNQAPVPEPSSIWLAMIALISLGLLHGKLLAKCR